jgi:glycosyltransferase involved in cell wall biosynthesis
MTAPVPVLVFQNRFLLGGQERQTVLHLTTLDRTRWEPVVRCLRLEGAHLDDLAALGLRAEGLRVTKLAHPWTAWQVARLAADLRARGVRILHAQDFYTNLLGLVTARLARVPAVVTRVDLAHALDPVQKGVLAAASRAADRVLVNALCIRDACLRDGVPAERIAVVRNGLDLAAFDRAAAAAPEGLDLSGRLVVQVANMNHPVKGQADLLLAWREVAREVPEARLLLVGDGARRAALTRLAAELGVAERVTFAGHRRDAAALLQRAEVAVSSSYAEGISNSVLEALAARRPLVATAVGGTPEVVRDGVTGLLVPPGAPAQLARRILEALRDPAAARALGETGRAVVAREFGVEAMRRSYDALYAGLLAEGVENRRRAA